MMKKKALLTLILPLILAGCGGGNGGGGSKTPDNPSGGGGGGGEQPVVTKYTVTFANTSMASVKIEAGKTLSKPADPTKANSMFVGWYLDASFTEEAKFPITVNSDLTLYAKFYSYQEAFQKARKNTIVDPVGYEYDYTLRASAGYMGITFNGNTNGNTKYNSQSTDVSFYDEHVNSGSLFYDGTKYSIKKGNDLHEISLDENGVVKKYDIKEVGDDYKYDSSSFAKAIFEYDDSKLKEIKPTSTASEYELKTTFNASAGIALVGNYLNHPMVEKLIGSLPETSVSTGMFVTFSGDKLNTYRYEMNINVSDIAFSLTYLLTFKNVGRAPSINPKAFNNTYISNTDINKMKNEINGYLNAYKTKTNSSHDFLVKTAVDYPKKNAINATVNGWSKRKVSNGVVYYLNDYEIDTDHKNADLYKAAGLKDCHGGRVKLSTGEVHDLKKKLLGGYSDVKTVTHNSIDDYYLLDVLEMANNVSFIQKITDSSKGTITYAIGNQNSGAINVLKQFNNSLRLNALGESSTDVKAFGSFSDSSVTIKNFKFKIIIANGALSEINLEMNGKMTTSFPGSRDFTSSQDAGYKLEYKLTVTTDGNSYEPAATVDKVK